MGSNVRCLRFAPKEYGCILVVGLENGEIHIMTFASKLIYITMILDGMWDLHVIHALETPVSSISFGPASYTIQELRKATEDVTIPPLRFVVAAEDENVYEWVKIGKNDYAQNIVGTHKDVVTDVAWSSNIGLNEDIIASAGKDKAVYLWQRPTQNDSWEVRSKISFDHSVNAISWNQTGKFNSLCTEPSIS